MAQLRAAQLARQKASLPQNSHVAESSSDSSAEEAEDEAEIQDCEIPANLVEKPPGTISNDRSTPGKASRPTKANHKKALKLLRKERRRAKQTAKRQKNCRSQKGKPGKDCSSLPVQGQTFK